MTNKNEEKISANTAEERSNAMETGKKEQEDRNEFVLPEKNRDSSKMYEYLTKTKGLSEQVVSYFENKGLIYEDANYNVMVSLGRDPQGEVRNAALQGDSAGMKFLHMEVPGNDKNYGVNIVNPDSSELKVFGDVIDCMSYMDITGDYDSNKLVLKMQEDYPLEQFLKDNSQIEHICFCLENYDLRVMQPHDDEYLYRQKAALEDEMKKMNGRKEKYEQKGYQVSIEKSSEDRGKDYNGDRGNQKSNAALESKEDQGVINRKRRGR